MRLLLVLGATCALASMVLVSGCKIYDSTCDEDDRECLGNPLFARGVGGDCERTGQCKDGLFCIDGRCEFTGETDRGDKCRLTGECGDVDYCGATRVCGAIAAGSKDEGGECVNSSYCEHGLVCEPPELSQLGTLSLGDLATLQGSCAMAGSKEQGEACERVSDCMAGLACRELEEGGQKRCLSLFPLPFEPPALIPPTWSGVDCPEVDESAVAESYFTVPRGGEAPGDFYTLPFPNDIRRRDGHLDLSTHPVPPASFNLPFVERYIDVAQQDLDGFSTNPVVFFQFSQPYDFESVNDQAAKKLNVKLIDITKGSPGYNSDASIEWKTTAGDVSNYICPNWLAVRRPIGSPLRPGTTYAAVVMTGLRVCGEIQNGKCAGAGPYTRGQDFEAMLGDSAPSDGVLREAWQDYAPLREWIDDTNTAPGEILGAAVFTTQDSDAIVPKLREQIHGEPVPSVSEVVECPSPGTQTPCTVGERGRCAASSDQFTEVHGMIRLPVFQQGTPPYFELEQGGGIELDADGDPVIQDHLDVCFAMSVPKAAAPPEGFPVLVYAHGTGGVFNGEMGSGGLAQTVATGPEPAVLVAIDLPQHGKRRGDSEEEPEGLFYNFLNPRAARDNVLQGAADLMSVVRWVKAGSTTVGGDLVKFDGSRIALMGHSQGATHTSLIAPFEPDAIGVVLSGNGGHLSTSMLTKESPVDIASVVPFGLMDPDREFKLAGGDYNPALALIQSVFDRADPINYAPLVQRAPVTPNSGAHLFMTYGRRDTFSPVETQRAYASAAGLPVVEPVLMGFDPPSYGLTAIAAPAEENLTVNGQPFTIGMRQYEPSSDSVDGHFVGVREGEAGRVDVNRFLRELLDGQAPAIGQ